MCKGTGRRPTGAVPPAPLPGRCLLGFQQIPAKAPGVFFHGCVLPETKRFESPFPLRKVERGRGMELPLLKQRGHPNVTPSPNPFFHPEAGGFLVPSAVLLPFLQGTRLFRSSCVSDSAALLVQLRAIVRPGARWPLRPRSCPGARPDSAFFVPAPRESALEREGISPP